MAHPNFERTPLALIIDEADGSARALEAVLSSRGYAVLKAYNGRQAVQLLGKVHPDVVFLENELPDGGGPDLCRRLNRTGALRPGTPVVLTTARDLAPNVRVRAFEAGVWDIVGRPLEEEELAARLNVYVAAKQRADAEREESLMDSATGFYNVRGILKRFGEVTADAARNQRPLACVVLGPERPATLGEQGSEPVPMDLAVALTSTIRLSDAIGRLGTSDFIVVAPGTDLIGASRLAERLLERVDAAGPLDPPARLRAGFCALPEVAPEGMFPADLITRATLALRKAQEETDGDRARAYQA